MTNDEFVSFTNRLFVQFPSLYEWLQRASPDPLATQALWRDTLKQCTYAECSRVLARWQEGGQCPFEAYQRDQVANIVRSCVQKERDAAVTQQRRQQETALRHERRKQNRRGEHAVGEAITARFDKGMRAAYEELRPHYKAMANGETTRSAYDAIEARVLEEMV